MAKKGFDSTPNRKGVDGLGAAPRGGQPAGQQAPMPRPAGIQGQTNAHLAGFGDREKQLRQHQRATQNSGPDWGGQKRQAKRNRGLELLATAVLLITGIILFIAYVMPFFSTNDAPNLDYNPADINSPLNLPGSTYTGLQAFGASGAIGLFGVLAFIFTLLLIIITILRLIVVADKLKQLKFLDSPFGNILMVICGLAVALFAFLLFSSVSALVAQGDQGYAVIQPNFTIKESLGGLSILMPFGFIAFAVSLGVMIINILTTATYKKAVKPTADTVKELKAQGNNFGFDRRANTFNRQAEAYQPAPIRTLAETAGPAFGQEQPMMDMQYPVDEFGNPIMPTEQDLQQGIMDNGMMMGQEPYAPQAPHQAPPQHMPHPQHQAPHQAPPPPRPAPMQPPVAPPPSVADYVAQAPMPQAPAGNSGLSPAEAAKQRLAEAKAKLEAAKNK